jgi:hypothetical protein
LLLCRWEPAQRDSDDEDFTKTSDSAPPELIDGKPKCQYGAACYRRNPDHKADYWHPPPATASVGAAVESAQLETE